MSKNTDRYSAAELQKKYAGTGYKATSNTGMAASSFWLGDAFLEEKESSKSLQGIERKSADYVRLAAYQRAVSNFVRIVTGRGDIPVKYSVGQDSYTDGKSVVLSAKLDEKEFDPAVGLALHEGSHIALTDFQYSSDVFYRGKYPQKLNDFMYKPGTRSVNQSMYKILTNIIEDRRIDRFVYDSAPGYQAYYQALYKKYFNSKEIDMALKAGLKNDPTMWDDYIFHITNFVNPNRNLTVLPALKQVWDIIDIPNINRLKSTKEVFEVAADVYIVIHEAIDKAFDEIIAKQREAAKPKPEPKPKPQPKQKQEQEEEDDELNEDLDVPQSSMSMESEKGEESEDTDESEDAEDTEDSEDESDNDGAGSGSEESDEETDEESDEEFTGLSSTEGEESEESEEVTESDEETEEEIDEAAEAAKKAEQEKLLNKIGKELNKAIKKQKDFLEGKTDKKSLTKTDAVNVQAAAKSNATYEAVGGEVVFDDGRKYDMGKTKVMVVRGLSTELIKSGMLGGHATDPVWARKRIERGGRDYIAEGITLGTMLGKRLKTRDEERSLKTSRLEAGRIDKRLIAELGFGNDRVFAQTQFNTVRPAYVHLSLDASGSMAGKAWEAAMKTAVAIAKAGSMISSLDVVISVRGTVSDTALMWVIYDSRKDKLQAVREQLLSVQASGSTPEGLCFEAIQKEMIKDARGKDAYFINFSDGAPSFGDKNCSYHGEVAYIHTRNCCNTLRNASINILSYFISNSERSAYGPFDRMYGKDAAYIDTDSLTQLAKTLNTLFERKQ